MVEFSSREHLQPSLLDRLTDNAPDTLRDPPDQSMLTLAQLRNSVLRDLAWLFATIRLEVLEELDGLNEVRRSVLNYGLPAFTGLTSGGNRIAQLENAIAEAIRFFEPRILRDTLKVKLRGLQNASADGALVFEIQGELWAQPVPLRILLETAIEPESNTVSVVEARARG
ncbi:type VI secretion system baseplate subunit TssE [Siccirubricoccus phaeus]|uniref:type VI secretion system baseplate subunit TssE n=1 Tax=Siccirubricoccus phaeus TaxID=2595053 RepID=UPI0011F3A7EE|nr:type VI secretion system baseplate subunit TssE [Siccirubricoccus phaeus]